MINILLSGCNGRMGKAVIHAIQESPQCHISGGIDIVQETDIYSGKNYFPVFLRPTDFVGEADVIIDFSHHTAVDGLLAFATKNHMPIVIATTGHTAEETQSIRDAATYIPVFYSRNMSIGVNLLIELAKKAAAKLGENFDIEIIEKHHNQKLDAPSGTALMIADAVSEVTPYSPTYVYDRHDIHEKRKKEEIGIHSIRGGTIVGEHDVIFAGAEERITISHSASSREVFAYGALRAAEFLYNKPTGLYTMQNLIQA